MGVKERNTSGLYYKNLEFIAASLGADFSPASLATSERLERYNGVEIVEQEKQQGPEINGA